MSKPVLPTLPETFTSWRYTPSGRFSVPGVGAMLAQVILGGILVGAIAYGASTLMRHVAALATSIIFRIFPGNLMPSILTVVVVGAVGAMFLLGIGILAALVVSQAYHKGKCRNKRLIFIASLLCVALIIAVDMYLTYSELQRTFTISKIGETLSALFPGAAGERQEQSDIGLTVVMIGFEGALLLVIVYSWANGELGSTPFCEKCETWYQQKGVLPLAVESAPSLLALLQDGSSHDGEVLCVPDTQRPRINLTTRMCPQCGASQVGADVLWQEKSVDSKGKVSTSNPIEPWFNVLLPQQIAAGVEKALSALRNQKAADVTQRAHTDDQAQIAH